MNPTLKRYLVSSLVTFLTAFCVVLVAQIDNLSLETFKDGSWLGVIFLCGRAGIKAVAEFFIAFFASKE